MQEDIDAEVGARLRELRLELEWTQPQIAELLTRELGKRVDPTMVTKTEKGRRPILASELFAYARIYGVSMDQLLVPEGEIRFVYNVLEAADKLREAETELLDMGSEYEHRRDRLNYALSELEENVAPEDIPETFIVRLGHAASLRSRDITKVFADRLDREAEAVLGSHDEE
ncbi:MAG TPA: helix-turn-helix domain-containing protein [Candidatus Dietzia merdigallinarum]|nr:helix-turn-helix domain-containing protein [Candidatus Dietzia merdigallinarum]